MEEILSTHIELKLNKSSVLQFYRIISHSLCFHNMYHETAHSLHLSNAHKSNVAKGHIQDQPLYVGVHRRPDLIRLNDFLIDRGPRCGIFLLESAMYQRFVCSQSLC